MFGPGVRGDLDRVGRLVDVSGSPIQGLRAPAPPTLSATAARSRAAASAGGPARRRIGAAAGAQRVTRFTDAESARLVLFPTASGTRLAWQVVVDGEHPYRYEIVVDAAGGRVLYRRDLTVFDNDDSATVFESWPGGPGLGGTQQAVGLDGPDGTWLDDSNGGTRLFGNDSHAYADVNGSNSDNPATEDVPRDGTGNTYRFGLRQVMPSDPSQPCPPAGAGGCTWDPGDLSSQDTNREEATTQAFYFVNRFHDHLAADPIGFDAASDNFQQTNPPGEGHAGDPVITEANDAVLVDPGSRNNANMSTDPTDGVPPRMQMYLFTDQDGSGFGAVDGADEADIVYHEYTHGLSTRLVPHLGFSGGQGGAMGEAWSDFYAMDFLVSQGYLSDGAAPGELRAGGYVGLGQDLIRTQPIDCPVGTTTASCPNGGYDYGDYGSVIGFPEVHADGEIWGETLWDIRQALGSDVALTLVTGAMRLSPPDPSYLDMRDALVREDGAAYGAAHFSRLSAIFAARGMGSDASSNGSGDEAPVAGFSPLVSFSPRSVAVDDTTGGDGDHVAEPGEGFDLAATARNELGGAVTDASATLSEPSPGLTVGGAATFPGSWPTGTDKTSTSTLTGTLSASATCGETAQATLLVTTSQGTFPTRLTLPTGSRAATPPVSSGTDVPIPDADPAGVDSTVALSGSGTVKGVRVTIGSLTHTFDSNLVISLVHTGKTVVLADGAGGDGQNFTGTVFRDDATTPIDDGTAPFTAPSGLGRPSRRSTGWLEPAPGPCTSRTWSRATGARCALGATRRTWPSVNRARRRPLRRRRRPPRPG